jgi:hypothetical protein
VSCDSLTTIDSLRICQSGVPEECPECNLERIRWFKDTSLDFKDILAKYPLPTELSEFSCTTMPYQRHLDSFIQSQANVLDSFYYWAQKQVLI